MSNISHAHGRIPTNDPNLWGGLVIFVMLSLTTASDAEHIRTALEGAAAFLVMVQALRTGQRGTNP
ncbi:hypothetical protein ACWEP8_37035 [Streptomyces hydrogenans]